MSRLVILETTRLLRFARHGRLLPWLGPALRGLAGGRLRASACVLPVIEQIGARKYCAGCLHMAGCSYGETYEPDPAPGLHLAMGWENTARPLVVAPAFPLPDTAEPGMAVQVNIVFIGRAAAGHVDKVWEALRIGGADAAIGLGDDHVLFDIESNPDPVLPEEVQLPFDASKDDSWAPLVRVELSSPLFVNEAGPNGRKRAVLDPTFGQLVRAGLRVLGPLHKLYAEPLPDHVFGYVKTAAETVPTIHAAFHEFRQSKWSHRSKDKFEMRGAIGWAEYGPVPGWLLPWLTWAGRVHVGTHRITGAGGWRVLA